MNYQTKFINPREILLSSEKIYLDKDTICINNKVIIEPNSNIDFTLFNPEINYQTYFINNFREKITGGIKISEFKVTQTSELVLPLLFNHKDRCLFNHVMVNAYRTIDNIKNPGDLIYLVFRWMPFSYYEDYIKWLSLNPFYNSLKKSTDNRFDIVEFKITDELILKDIKKIYKGNYQNIDELSKFAILYFNDLNDTSELFKVLYNDKLYREELEIKLKCKIPNNISLKDKIDLKYERFNNITKDYC